MVEQRSPKPSVACSTRVSPAKSKHSVLAFCFQKKGRASLHAKHLLPNAVASDATLRFAIPSLRSLRLTSLCQKQALCACFLFSKKRESESPRKAFVAKFSPADATLRSAIPSLRSLRLAAPLPKASTLCLLFVYKKGEHKYPRQSICKQMQPG